MTTSIECPRKITMQAPVLFIPNVLNVDFCKHLIKVWEIEGNVQSYTMMEKDGKLVKVTDYNQKDRRDHFITEGETQDHLKHFIRQRVIPVVRKTFRFEITRAEEFRICCYDASTGGYFRPHRDDATEATAYRSFAMTLNLNVGEYEGGYLRFPEYGSDLYQPEIGSAVIFSTSLLHEATDVTKGKRFVLLSFFYGEKEAQQLEEYKRQVAE